MDENYKHPVDEKKVKFRLNILETTKEGKSWILMITAVSFILSASLSFISSSILKDVNNIIAICVVLIIILINIISDIIGTAVTAADEAPFHAMASRKLYGARQSIRLIRNADKVSNFCNDVVGDICGVISGAAGAFIILRISGAGSSYETTFAGLVITGLIASAIVGGKAVGKIIAIENSNYIVYRVGVLLKFIAGRINFEKAKRKKMEKLKER